MSDQTQELACPLACPLAVSQLRHLSLWRGGFRRITPGALAFRCAVVRCLPGGRS